MLRWFPRASALPKSYAFNSKLMVSSANVGGRLTKPAPETELLVLFNISLLSISILHRRADSLNSSLLISIRPSLSLNGAIGGSGSPAPCTSPSLIFRFLIRYNIPLAIDMAYSCRFAMEIPCVLKKMLKSTQT